MLTVEVDIHDVRPGDWAWHHNGLDPRTVTRVDHNSEGSMVWLNLTTNSAGPFWADNYTFTRREKRF